MPQVLPIGEMTYLLEPRLGKWWQSVSLLSESSLASCVAWDECNRDLDRDRAITGEYGRHPSCLFSSFRLESLVHADDKPCWFSFSTPRLLLFFKKKMVKAIGKVTCLKKKIKQLKTNTYLLRSAFNRWLDLSLPRSLSALLWIIVQ